MIKSYKYRIYPTKEQEEKMKNFFGVARLIYNLGLQSKIYAYQSRKKLSTYDLIRQLTDMRKEFKFIKECPIDIQQQSLLNMEKAFSMFFKGKGFPKFKNKYSKQSIKFIQHIHQEHNRIKLPKLGWIKAVTERNVYGKIKNATLSKTVTGKYYVSITFDTLIDIPNKVKIDESSSVGIDLGIKEYLITSDGEYVNNPKFLKTSLRKLRIEQRSLARKVKGSNNYHKQRIRVAKVNEHIRNQRMYFLHNLSTRLVKENDTLILESLQVKNMVKNRKLSRTISDAGWSMFVEMLKYKSEWFGKNLIQINTFFPSSKKCSVCGNVKKELKLSERTYRCEVCGTELDRDYNASLNIKQEGLLQAL